MRHIIAKYYFINNQGNNGGIEVVYCTSEKMIGNYYIRPLLGNEFTESRNVIMMSQDIHLPQERVGDRNDNQKSDKSSGFH